MADVVYPLASSTWGAEEIEAIQDVIASDMYTMGRRVKQFEQEYADHFDHGYAVMCNSGSSANLLMLSLLKLKYKLTGDIIVPAVGWSTSYFPVNQNGFKILLDCCVDKKVEKFIFASSSSVYGISDSPKVTESHPRVPVSLYNITKAWCEDILINDYKELPYVIVRPATICGYSKRLRLDLSVNLLTSHGIKRRKIDVFGGDQFRPNLNIKDMIDFYYFLLTEEYERFNREIFNISYKNYKIMEIAEIIKDKLKSKVGDIEINVTKSNDPRSYRVNCEKLESVGFECRFGIEDAVDELFQAFESNLIKGDISGTKYNNVKMMLKKEIT